MVNVKILTIQCRLLKIPDLIYTIVSAFSIEIESYENVFKLSQNHSAENKKSIVDHLQQRGDYHSDAIAKEMEKL